MKMNKRILIIAPQNGEKCFSDAAEGGRALYEELKGRSDCEPFYLGLRFGHSDSLFRTAENEYFWDMGPNQPFWLENSDTGFANAVLEPYLCGLKPDAISIHFGKQGPFNLLAMLAAILPEARLGASIYGLEPLCASAGGLVLADGAPCSGPDLEKCSKCQNGLSPLLLWQRQNRLRRYLAKADALITPSAFLQDEYVAWGLEPGKMFLIENCLPQLPLKPDKPEQLRKNPVTFGFFGELEPLAGLQFVLGACALLPEHVRPNIRLAIFSTGLGRQPEGFREEMARLRANFPISGSWEEQGVDLEAHIDEIDWLLAPSLGASPQLSPLQKAAFYRKPVVGSDRGSISEKILHGVNGWLVPPEDVKAWAQALETLGGNVGLWKNLREGIQPPVSSARVGAHYQAALGLLEDSWA